VDPVRVKKTRQNKESRAPFRFNRNGKGSSHVLRWDLCQPTTFQATITTKPADI